MALACFFAMTLAAAAQELSASNTSRYVGDGRWDWTVFIVAPREVLQNISCVEYRLHPTFPDPVRKVCQPGHPDLPFGLSTNGWGAFQIDIKVTFKNGEVRALWHVLVLEARPVERPLKISADNSATQVRSGWWDWTVFIEAPDEVLRQIRCVEYTLHPTFPDPVRTICRRGTGRQAFALHGSGWGTFQIRIRVILNDGRIQELTHHLRF